MNTAPPAIGTTFDVRGVPCRAFRVHPFGTVDVEAPDGSCYRLTGFAWISAKPAKPPKRGRWCERCGAVVSDEVCPHWDYES
jgi:hypothetical protein